jgi:hypothetical protein
MARYELTPAWHVIDMADVQDSMGREMAAATSAADGDAIVDALNGYRGAVDEIERLRRWIDTHGRGCPSLVTVEMELERSRRDYPLGGAVAR